jgi:AcrR family transcriptional regulator
MSAMDRAEAETEPRVPLSKERVLLAAFALADRDGFEALTMRKLADELGVGVMSLYHYFANKDELLDGMVDIVFSEIDLPSTEVDWKTAMRQRAISTREALARHRWAVGLMESRLTPGPASLQLHNAVLGCLRGAGFSIEMAIQAYSVQDAYIYGFALQEKNLPFASPGESAEVAETQVQQFGVAELADAFPHLAEVVGGHVAKYGYDFAGAFEFGLGVILDGLDTLRSTV